MVLIAASSPRTGDLFFGCALQHRLNGLAAEAREVVFQVPHNAASLRVLDVQVPSASLGPSSGPTMFTFSTLSTRRF